jgi:hypothetical protein
MVAIARLQIVNESGDMERLDLNQVLNSSGGAAIGKATSGVQVGPPGMSVLIWAVKNSRTRRAAFGVGAKSAAGWKSAEGALIRSFVPPPIGFINA